MSAFGGQSILASQPSAHTQRRAPDWPFYASEGVAGEASYFVTEYSGLRSCQATYRSRWRARVKSNDAAVNRMQPLTPVSWSAISASTPNSLGLSKPQPISLQSRGRATVRQRVGSPENSSRRLASVPRSSQRFSNDLSSASAETHRIQVRQLPQSANIWGDKSGARRGESGGLVPSPVRTQSQNGSLRLSRPSNERSAA